MDSEVQIITKKGFSLDAAQKRVEEIYEKLQEQETVETDSSNEKKNLINELITQTIEIAENLWKHTVVFVDSSKISYEQKKYVMTSDDFDEINYGNVIRWILNGYDKNKAKSSEHSFWNYYISSLRNEVYRNYSRERAKFYYPKNVNVPQKIQRGINLIVHIRKKNNFYENSVEHLSPEEVEARENIVKSTFVQNIQEKIKDYESKGKKFWMPKNCKTPEEFYDYLIEFNNMVYKNNRIYKKENKDDEDKASDDFMDSFEDEKTPSFLDKSIEIGDIRDKLFNLQSGFSSFINRKHQNKEAQVNKINFYREIVTYYLLLEISNNFPQLLEQDYYDIFEGLNFTSKNIITQFLNSNELNLKTISLAWKRPENYASKQLTVIKKVMNLE